MKNLNKEMNKIYILIEKFKISTKKFFNLSLIK